MDYQVDPAKIPVPWGRIIAVNIVVTLVAAFLFNFAFDLLLPSGVFSRLKDLERKTAEMEVNFEKIFGKIKIGN